MPEAFSYKKGLFLFEQLSFLSLPVIVVGKGCKEDNDNDHRDEPCHGEG